MSEEKYVNLLLKSENIHAEWLVAEDLVGEIISFLGKHLDGKTGGVKVYKRRKLELKPGYESLAREITADFYDATTPSLQKEVEK